MMRIHPPILAYATQPELPDEPYPEPHVPRPIPSPDDPPSPNAPQPAIPEVPGPWPMHPDIPNQPITATRRM